MSPDASPELKGVTFFTRLRIGMVVAANIALALAVGVGLTWLSSRPGLRARVDLSRTGINSLQDVSKDVLDHLPEGEAIEIDVFFRTFEQPLTGIAMMAQDWTQHLLQLVEQYRPGLVRLKVFALTIDPESRAPLEERMRDLGLKQTNVVVVSRGARREIINLLGDIAVVDIGHPGGRGVPPRAPSLQSFRGEEMIVRAMLKVSTEESPKVLFAWGQGEYDLYGDGLQELGMLHSALTADGFQVARWVPEEDGEIPEDCSVLAIISPTEPFGDEARESILDFVQRGGRLVVAPHYEVGDEAGSVRGLLAEFGIVLGEGFVAAPLLDANGQRAQGDARSSALVLRASQLAPEHPITRPLRLGDRSVRLALSQFFERGKRPPGGSLLDILATDASTWADRVPNDWVQGPDEQVGPFSLAMTSVFVPDRIGPELPGEDGVVVRDEARVFAVGAGDVFANSIFPFNRDFALNVFNWAASREYHVNVSTRDPDAERLPLNVAGKLSTVRAVAIWGLPLLCIGLGFFTFLRRRR